MKPRKEGRCMSLTVSIDPIFWLLCRRRFPGAGGHDLAAWYPSGLRQAARQPCSAACLPTRSGCRRWCSLRSARSACWHSSRWPNGCTKQPTPTNGDRALGREARVLTPVSAQADGPGAAGWRGLERPLRHPRRYPRPPGKACRVTEIHSTLLIVEPILYRIHQPLKKGASLCLSCCS